MLSIFSNINGLSPVSQDFIWLGEYYDGTHLAEFNFTDKKENSFYSIERQKLIRFGLIGHGMKLFFEPDGVFNLNGTAIEVAYRLDDMEYSLTGHSGKYNDIITYKDAESALNAAGGVVRNQINQYSFGYKTNLEIDGIKFTFKALCKIPFGQPLYMNFWLVANKKLNGVLVVKRNNRIVAEIDAPLKKGAGGEINYTLF